MSGEQQLGKKRVVYSYLLFWVLVIISYIISPEVLPFIPFLIISPLLYHFRKFMGYFAVFLWYTFLWILYFISLVDMGIGELVSSALLMGTIYIHGYILLKLREHVTRYYSDEDLRSERTHVFFLGLFLFIIAFFLNMLTIPIPIEVGKDLLGYIVLSILLTSALIYAFLNFVLKLSEIKSEYKRDVILLIFVLGLLIIAPAYMMGYSDVTTYYSKLPLLLYSYFLISIGSAFTMLILQSE